jgi:hypothetical protein
LNTLHWLFVVGAKNWFELDFAFFDSVRMSVVSR